MKAEEKIKQALSAKNWKLHDFYYEPVKYYPSGREGGYEINIELEEYQEATDELVDKYFEVFNALDKKQLQRNIDSQGEHVCECGDGIILAYNLPDVMFIINELPDRLSI